MSLTSAVAPGDNTYQVCAAETWPVPCVAHPGMQRPRSPPPGGPSQPPLFNLVAGRSREEMSRAGPSELQGLGTVSSVVPASVHSES